MQLKDLLTAFLARDRRALAQAITLVESDNENDRANAHIFLEQIAVSTPTLRIALSGPPGVGKSTLINALAKKLRAFNYRVAILPIDPSSDINRGSILADKTRMGELLNDEEIFIRPSSSRARMGGVTSATHDVLFVVESFGFNAVIIETVGVGQSESLAHALVDHFIVLMQPGAGDQLQALKKGVLERADMLVVNKWDEAQKALAESSFRMLKAHTHAPVFLLSAAYGDGVDAFVTALLQAHENQQKNIEHTRQERFSRFFYYAFEQRYLEKIYQRYAVRSKGDEVAKRIIATHAALAPKLEQFIDDIIADNDSTE